MAMFWDKVGLGHYGERQPDGGHKVFFVGPSYATEYIGGSRWAVFLEEQKKLLEERKTRKVSEAVK